MPIGKDFKSMAYKYKKTPQPKTTGEATSHRFKAFKDQPDPDRAREEEASDAHIDTAESLPGKRPKKKPTAGTQLKALGG